MRLAELQTQFVAMLDGDTDISSIFALGPVPISRAFEVHRITIASAFIRVLAICYPTVEALVGAEFFERMALDYRDTRLEMDATLRGYGKAFGCFVAGYEHARGLPYLADVARLDWAVDQCQAAEDDFEHFAIDQSVSLELSTSLTLLTLSFPATQIRAAIFDNDEDALAALDMSACRRAAAVWRAGRNVIVSSLALSAFGFLTALKAGATPDDALAAAAAANEHPADVLRTLQTDVFAAAFARVRHHNNKVDL